MTFRDELKQHIRGMMPDAGKPPNIVDFMLDVCSQQTVDAIEADVRPSLDAAIAACQADLRATIRELAGRLPENDPLREAIESVQEGLP